MFGVNLWHWSHFLTYSYVSFCIFGHQYPWVMARCDRDLPPVWLPQMPSCSSSRSDSDISGCTQSRYGPEKDHLYNFLSLDNQNWGAFLRIFSASIFFLGKVSLSRNFNMGSIQLGARLTWWTWRTSFSGEVGVCKSSTIITRGNSVLKRWQGLPGNRHGYFHLGGCAKRWKIQILFACA